jgi:hypothetical protein
LVTSALSKSNDTFWPDRTPLTAVPASVAECGALLTVQLTWALLYVPLNVVSIW